jgi:hypothetical protein
MPHRRESGFAMVGSDKISAVSLSGAVAQHLDDPDVTRRRLSHAT